MVILLQGFVLTCTGTKDCFAVGVVLYALLMSAWPQTRQPGEFVTWTEGFLKTKRESDSDFVPGRLQFLH